MQTIRFLLLFEAAIFAAAALIHFGAIAAALLAPAPPTNFSDARGIRATKPISLSSVRAGPLPSLGIACWGQAAVIGCNEQIFGAE